MIWTVQTTPTIVYVSPGPTYNAHSPLYQDEYEGLSQRYQGCILTTSPVSETFRIGRFQYTSMKSLNRRIDSIRFLTFCVCKSIALRLKGDRIDLVTSYDPVKTGLIALVVSRIHGARFAPQVNGVLTSDALWLDEAMTTANRSKRMLYRLLMRFVLKRANGIRLLFKEQIDDFRPILDDKVISAFHCYVPTEAFRDLGERREVLFVGFPFKLKGVDVLIEAFKRVAPRYPDWRLKILGWYPNPNEIREAINGHPQIYLHPPVKYEQMVEHIGSCAVLVLPSRSEAMGRVLVEAMAAAKPRIGSRVDGIPTVIDDGVDGYLVEPGNVSDLAERLDRLMGDPSVRRAMGLAGKARISREFTKELYLENVSAFYEKILRA